MKKLVEKLLNWCKKSMKMRICVGKSANPERVLPSMAMETVGETVLPAAVEAVGMAETITESNVSSARYTNAITTQPTTLPQLSLRH